VSEIVIVDWSTKAPIADLLDLDPRVRIVRVESEPTWILSYAYNLGIEQASRPLILKCDADCYIRSGISDCVPGDRAFYAGYWQSGHAAGKPSVNGQCLITKQQFEHVNGYSELIRTYGRDDEDFYERLTAAGHSRREAAVHCFDFIDHSIEDRVVNQVPMSNRPGLDELILRQPVFHEIRNAALAKHMPWGKWMNRSRYRIVDGTPRRIVMTRDRTTEIPIPPPVIDAATLQGLRYLVGQGMSLPETVSRKLDQEVCLLLLAELSQSGFFD
jgi:hypothetical protein